MVIQERDREILRHCYEHQFLMMEHIEDYFFLGRSKAKARERIVELQKSGYLIQLKDSVFGQRKILRLTTRGEEVARSGHRVDVPQVRMLSAATLMHDSIVTSVRIRATTFWPDARFVPERAIKKEAFAQIPDGIFYFSSGNGIAFEVENSPKGKRRFVRLLHRWKNVPSIVFVVFVTTTPELSRLIKRYLPFGPPEQPMGVVAWDDLRISAPKVWTPKGDVDLFSRREF